MVSTVVMRMGMLKEDQRDSVEKRKDVSENHKNITVFKKTLTEKTKKDFTIVTENFCCRNRFCDQN